MRGAAPNQLVEEAVHAIGESGLFEASGAGACVGDDEPAHHRHIRAYDEGGRLLGRSRRGGAPQALAAIATPRLRPTPAYRRRWLMGRESLLGLR